MKRILITGKNSYIGNSFTEWVSNYYSDYLVTRISVRDEDWKSLDFSGFDTVIHVAGIAHVSKDPKLKDKYYFVNSELTIDLAKKAKKDGVKQFVFLSSIIVYGDQKENGGKITLDTIPNPEDFYGDSKLRAENGIKCLDSDEFKVVIIRPPMIYGKGSKGNFPKLIKISRTIPFFPIYENKRSMLYIDNLSEFIRLLICNEERGMFFPQNQEYVNTSNLVKQISIINNKKVWLIPGLKIFIKVLCARSSYINKVFGNLYYSQEISKYKVNYQVKNLSNSLLYTTEE